MSVQKSRQEHPDASRVRPGHAQTAGTVRTLPAELLALQRMAGNRAVVSLLTARNVRPELGLQAGAVVQRLFTPEDVSSEMVGQRFQVTEAFTAGSSTVAAGGQVEILAWTNASSTVHARLPPPAAATAFDIPKRILRPVHPAAGGLSQYGTNIGATVKDMEAGQKKIDTELAKKGGPNHSELSRLQTLQQNRERLLNQKMIEETMFNRFDPIIQSWTDHYNALRTGADKLDANLVKSLLYQESQMGTAGKYLDLPDPIRTRFNIGQTIDSWPDQQLLMIRDDQPALIGKYHLENIDADLASAQAELKKLRKPGHPTAAEQPRHDELQALSQGNWQPFFMSYRATGQSTGFAEAITEFFATHAPGKPNRNLDYEFWIQTTIRYLFQKRKHTTTWQEAIRAYNGSGAAAKAYRDAVTRRASDAAASEAAGTEFVPTR
ncbi:MAG: hypothetical protein E6I88_01635 [Chloroflexi bacterium]|nr:MAG: hypothetical protein E6I88_01635 [Chloroflexota bacterium]